MEKIFWNDGVPNASESRRDKERLKYHQGQKEGLVKAQYAESTVVETVYWVLNINQ